MFTDYIFFCWISSNSFINSLAQKFIIVQLKTFQPLTTTHESVRVERGAQVDVEQEERPLKDQIFFFADLVRILVPHVLYIFSYSFDTFFVCISCYVMRKKNTILISFYRTLIIECLVLVALIFFLLEILLHSQHTSDSLSNYPFCLVCFYIPFRFQKSHLCNFSLITIELTSCYMCAIT